MVPGFLEVAQHQLVSLQLFGFMYTLVCFILSQICHTISLCSHLASVYHSNIDISGAIVFEINDSEYQLTLQRKALEQKCIVLL